MDSYNMAIVYGIKRRPIGKIWAHPSGSIAAATDGRRNPIGLFTSMSLAIQALMDLADKPLQAEGFIALVEALLIEDGDEIAASIEATPKRAALGGAQDRQLGVLGFLYSP